jgi:hypothetical protein
VTQTEHGARKLRDERVGQNGSFATRVACSAGEAKWGGHLERNEPISDADMLRWRECDWIREVESDGCRGYALTEVGREMLATHIPE